MSKIREKALKIAELPYTIQVEADETTEGDRIYVARVIELDGCIAQGTTIEDAVSQVQEAKVDYIESLLDDRIQVPHPMQLATVTNSLGTYTVTFTNLPKEKEGKSVKADPRLYEAVLQTQ